MNWKQENNGGISLIGKGAKRVRNSQQSNREMTVFAGQVARTDVTAKTIGVIPKGAIPCMVSHNGVANSDAGTTATLSIGHALGTEFVNAVSVKANSVNQTFPAAGAALGAAVSSDTTVTAVYAETGTASTAGGPWTVLVGYFFPET